jgi:hypothetical protein
MYKKIQNLALAPVHIKTEFIAPRLKMPERVKTRNVKFYYALHILNPKIILKIDYYLVLSSQAAV